jgi:hypothetical protein
VIFQQFAQRACCFGMDNFNDLESQRNHLVYKIQVLELVYEKLQPYSEESQNVLAEIEMCRGNLTGIQQMITSFLTGKALLNRPDGN